MRNCILTVSFIIILFPSAWAQEPCILNGTIKDSLGIALAGATSRLQHTGNDSASGGIRLLPAADGTFTTTLQPGAAWMILVTRKGYSPFRDTFSIPGEAREFHLPPIILRREFSELQPVVVEHVRPLTIKTDTVEYHAGAYSLREGAVLEDLVRKLPGMALDDDSI